MEQILTLFSLEDLERIIADREKAAAEASYTKSLLQRGPEHIAKKFGEEAVEAIIAAIQDDPDALRAEAADVLFHFLVLMKSRNISLESILSVLAQRTSQSGHSEKAGRCK